MRDEDIQDARVKLAILEAQQEIKSKVEADLFKYYRNLGSIILAVLAAVGITIGWPALTSLVKDEIAAHVEAPVEKAKAAAAEAESIANGILARLEEKQSRIQESMGRADHSFETMNSRYGKTTAQINEIEESLSEIRKLVDFFKLQVNSQPPRQALLETDKVVKELAAQTNLLAEEFKKLSQSELERQKFQKINDQLAKISLESSIADPGTRLPAELRTASIVYVQFAGGERERAIGMTDALKSKGWKIPGEERAGEAASKHEVRYFHDDDQRAAELLAGETNEAIAANNFTTAPLIARKTSVRTLPARGILEIWIEIPAS